MSDHEICSQLEICESLPINQKNSCYELVTSESIRHEVIMHHVGEGAVALFLVGAAIVALIAGVALFKMLSDY